MGGTPGKPMYRDVGDIVGSGIAVGNGVAYFTAVGSGKLIALDAATGKVLKEIDLGPVFAGPSVSRGRVYVGSGNTLGTPASSSASSPKSTPAAFGASDCPARTISTSLGIWFRLDRPPRRRSRTSKFPTTSPSVRPTSIAKARMAAEAFAPKNPHGLSTPHDRHEPRVGRYCGGAAPRCHRVRESRVLCSCLRLSRLGQQRLAVDPGGQEDGARKTAS